MKAHLRTHVRAQRSTHKRADRSTQRRTHRSKHMSLEIYMQENCQAPIPGTAFRHMDMSEEPLCVEI